MIIDEHQEMRRNKEAVTSFEDNPKKSVNQGSDCWSDLWERIKIAHTQIFRSKKSGKGINYEEQS